MTPLRSDTIRLVQSGCAFHGLRSEDPNQHVKDFLKIVDSIDLDSTTRELTRLRLFQFSLRDQACHYTILQGSGTLPGGGCKLLEIPREVKPGAIPTHQVFGPATRGIVIV